MSRGEPPVFEFYRIFTIGKGRGRAAHFSFYKKKHDYLKQKSLSTIYYPPIVV
jgi:hypothetical protein